jgi:hypothetical protein
MNIQRFTKMFVLCASLGLASSAFSQPDESTLSSDQAANVALTPLKLIHGWYNAPYGTSDAEVSIVNGIVHFKGAIGTAGTNPVAFVLPKEFRPSSDFVYVPIDLCNSTEGALQIKAGVVTVLAETSFDNARCFTSLDGASFALNANGFTTLKPLNGWAENISATNPAVEKIDGIVHFKGAIDGPATNPVAFVLPKGFRPAHEAFVSVVLCGKYNGQLAIEPNGTVSVRVQPGLPFSDAGCETSLDGAWFAASDTGFETLKLINSWSLNEIDSPARVRISDDIVYFEGSIWQSPAGLSDEPFVLPSSLRPATDVFVQVNLDVGYNGRLWIQPSGVVTIQAEGQFSDAQFFTTLDGVSFVR